MWELSRLKPTYPQIKRMNECLCGNRKAKETLLQDYVGTGVGHPPPPQHCLSVPCFPRLCRWTLNLCDVLLYPPDPQEWVLCQSHLQTSSGFFLEQTRYPQVVLLSIVWRRTKEVMLASYAHTGKWLETQSTAFLFLFLMASSDERSEQLLGRWAETPADTPGLPQFCPVFLLGERTCLLSRSPVPAD